MAKITGTKYFVSDIAEAYAKINRDVSANEALNFIKNVFDACGQILAKGKSGDTIRITSFGVFRINSWVRNNLKLRHRKTKQDITKDAIIFRVSFTPARKIKDTIKNRDK